MAKELLDVVDENDNVFETASKVACHIDNSLIHRGVSLLFDSTNRVFLTKRRENKAAHAGALDASVAGQTRSGEFYEQCAERKLKEELSVSLAEIKKVGKFNCFTASEQEIEGVFACKFEGELNLGEATFMKVLHAEGSWRRGFFR